MAAVFAPHACAMLSPDGWDAADANQACGVAQRITPAWGPAGMKRVDPWGDFLRRILLSASLAGVAGLAPTTGSAGPQQEMAEPEPQAELPPRPGPPQG
jgi:hypothetical protein